MYNIDSYCRWYPHSYPYNSRSFFVSTTIFPWFYHVFHRLRPSHPPRPTGYCTSAANIASRHTRNATQRCWLKDPAEVWWSNQHFDGLMFHIMGINHDFVWLFMWFFISFRDTDEIWMGYVDRCVLWSNMAMGKNPGTKLVLPDPVVPSGKHTKSELENGYRNSWFTHSKWWFSIVFSMFTKGYWGFIDLPQQTAYC